METGEWTRILIHDLNAWMGQKHGQMNFHLTQNMGGHGCFQKYLFKIGKVEASECTHCSQAQEDDSRHTVFVCDAWHQERSELKRSLKQIGEKEEFAPVTMVLIMLQSEDGWEKVSAFACQVGKRKMDAEWARQA